MASKRKTTRRQFLKGRSAVEAIGDLAAGEPLPAPAVVRPRAPYLMHVARRAMACEFAVFLNAGQPFDGPEIALKTLDLVEALEDQLTVYRAHSEVSGINRLAAEQWVVIEPGLFELLQRSLTLHAETDGAFDITSTPLSKVWGFFRREGRIPAEADLQEALGRVGSQWVELDAQQSAIRFLRPGLEINLGAIGKGYALDRAAEKMVDAGVPHFLIHGGQSSVLGRGTQVTSEEGQRQGWMVSLRHPLRPERKLAEIWLRDRALGTSGSAAQSFRHQGRRYGHILDPRTGWPAEKVLSSTVIAPDAALADALATAFYVMGVEAAFDYCSRHEGLAALLVTARSRAGAVEVHSIGLRDDDWQCFETA